MRRKIYYRKMFRSGFCFKSVLSSIQVRVFYLRSGLFISCTGYNLDIQLEALLGQREVEKLKRKLKAYGISHEMAENTFKFNDLFAFPPDIDMER